MIIYNSFWIPGKVPSLNELNDFRGVQGGIARSSIIMRQSSKKVKRGKVFNLYNITKQDWSKKVCKQVKEAGFYPVESCYFNYLVVENTKKRDPSNICSATAKLLEDGLIKAGVIPNDGWDNVLGIRAEWVLRRKAKPGVFLIMSDEEFDFRHLVHEYMAGQDPYKLIGRQIYV